MIPQNENTVLDGQLGIKAPASAALLIVGCSTTGTLLTPTPATRTEDVVAGFTSGPLVEQAAYAIERLGLRVLLVRVDDVTNGSYGALTLTGTGTSVPTGDVATTQPLNDFEPYIKIVTGGTIGVAGITYQDSLDGGRTLSGVKSLGTATQILIAEGGIDINLGAGTLVAGDVISTRTEAPIWDAAALAAGLDVARTTNAVWTYGVVCGKLTAADVATIDGKLAQMSTAGRQRRMMGHFRKPAVGESEATYLAAFDTAMAAASSKRLTLCAGWCETQSSISRRQYLAPPSIAAAAYVAAVGVEVEPSEIAYPLAGVTIRDANGNVKHHDETVNPGLDDSRALTLRTHEGRTGVYINNARLFSPVGSDYLWIPHGRVIDKAMTLVNEELVPELSKGVFVLTDGTGRISDDSAETIEGKVNGRLEREITGQREAVKCMFSLSRTDDVLRTGQIGYTTRVVPLAYVKKFKGTTALVASASADANVLNG